AAGGRWAVSDDREASSRVVASGKLPVDGRCALLLQRLVGAAERAGPEEATVGGVGAGVGGLDQRDPVKQGREAACVPAPQDGDERDALPIRCAPAGQLTDRLLGDLLPALPAVRGGLAGPPPPAPGVPQDGP